MQKPVQTEMNGQQVNGQMPNLHPRQHQVPANVPQHMVVVPQQPQMPQLPQLSEETYAGLQQLQMILPALPNLISAVATSPMHFTNTVADQMDEISNFAYGEEEFDFHAEFK